MRRFFRNLIILAVLAGGGLFFFNYYSYIFARRVKGEIISIERIQLNVSLIQQQGGEDLNPQLFSFAVAIKEPSGEIVTSSAEDRQWAVATVGHCADALFYPYPPWNLMKSGTYHNARLDHLSECPK